jgi:two-component system secretion response regulator SsrB
MHKIRLAIVDDHPLAINGIKTMLSTCPGVEVTASYSSGNGLMEGLKLSQPDILLLDILLPDISGKELAPLIIKQYPDIKIIALTSLDAPATIKVMMQRGCLGYLLKDADEHTLMEAIDHVYRGEEYIEASLKKLLLQHAIGSKKQGRDQHPELTLREKEVLKLIIAEYTTQEIADKLFISFRTVENHRYSLLQKLEVKNTAGLVRTALTMGLID